MPKGGNNNGNLKPFDKTNAKINGSNGGSKSVKVRREKIATRKILEILDSLDVADTDKGQLEALGLPDYLHTQQALRLIALHDKALTGDPVANRLLLEIRGEAPTQKVEFENQVSNIEIKFVDKTKLTVNERDPKIIGEYTPPLNTEA